MGYGRTGQWLHYRVGHRVGRVWVGHRVATTEESSVLSPIPPTGKTDRIVAVATDLHNGPVFIPLTGAVVLYSHFGAHGELW